jgi:hypothetical protein
MLEFNLLRIEQNDGSTVIEYRIEDGHVEGRTLRTGVVEKPWRPLTPEKLRSHVMAGTLLSRWLRRRMGIHQLVRACQQDQAFLENRGSAKADQPAA